MSGLTIFLVGILTLGCLYAVMALALSLHFGRTGIVNLGMVAFVAVGAYTCSICTIAPPTAADKYLFGFGLPLWVGFLAAAVVTALFAFIIGMAALRLREEYLAICTFAFAEALRMVLMNADKIANGLQGFWGLRAPFKEFFSGHVYSYVFLGMAAAFLLASYIFITRLERSPFGRVLKSIKENEEVTKAIGKDVWKFRVQSFTIGATLAGLAGAMYSWYTSLIVPNMFTSEITFVGWSAVVIGGLGNSKGAVIAAFILIFIEEGTRLLQISAEHAAAISSLRIVITGLLMVLLLRFKPGGILTKKKVIS